MELLIQRTVNKYRWESQKPCSGKEEKGLVVNSRGWLSLTIQAVDCTEVGSFLPILCDFLLLYWQATDLDWPAFENTWWYWLRSMFDMRIKIKYWPPISVFLDFHAPKWYLMLLIRNPIDIFFIQKCSMMCKTNIEPNKIKQANNVFLLVARCEKRHACFLHHYNGKNSSPPWKAAVICFPWVCRLSRKQIKIQMCIFQSEQEKMPSIMYFFISISRENFSCYFSGLASGTLFQGTRSLWPQDLWIGSMLFPRFLELAGCVQQSTLRQQRHSETMGTVRISVSPFWQVPCSGEDLRLAPFQWSYPVIQIHGCPGCCQPSPKLLVQGPWTCFSKARAACGPGCLCPCPYPVAPSHPTPEDIWMQQFFCCLYGKRLVIKAFQSAGNIYWLELHA